MDTKTYVPMPPHSRCNVNRDYYEIVSCRTISKSLATFLLDANEFENGVDRKQLKRSCIEDNSNWWYNNVEDMVMIKGNTGRFYIKKVRSVNGTNLANAYQIACDNYAVISNYVARKKHKMKMR